MPERRRAVRLCVIFSGRLCELANLSYADSFGFGARSSRSRLLVLDSDIGDTPRFGLASMWGCIRKSRQRLRTIAAVSDGIIRILTRFCRVGEIRASSVVAENHQIAGNRSI